MSISKKQRQQAIKTHGRDEKDTGSTSAQIALLTLRINDLQQHFKTHSKDKHSRRGLIGMVNRRRKLLDYLKRRQESEYLDLIKKLKIRR